MVWAKWGSVLMFLAVALGAFGAHALRQKLSPYSLDVYKTGVLYHMAHALGLFAVAWACTVSASGKANLAGMFMLAGIVLFSGSLYGLSVSGLKWLGAVTPLGGLCFLAAWALLFLSLTGGK